MSNTAGEVINEWGKYRIHHYQQHLKDSFKDFKPEIIMSKPVTFPRCSKCPSGYPVYTLKAIIRPK